MLPQAYMVCNLPLARQVLVQSSSSSRARSKRVMNQIMFNVPDPLVVHVLLLTHGLMYNVKYLPHSWYPQCDSLNCLICPNSPSLIYCGQVGLADA